MTWVLLESLVLIATEGYLGLLFSRRWSNRLMRAISIYFFLAALGFVWRFTGEFLQVMGYTSALMARPLRPAVFGALLVVGAVQLVIALKKTDQVKRG